MGQIKNTHKGTGNDRLVIDTAKPGQSRRPYTPPKVLSAEQLEAAAATCRPPAPPYGKTIPNPCGRLGS